MKSPLDRLSWLVLPETPSTQYVAAEEVRRDSPIRLVLAHHQSAGRGRFERVWVSSPGDSLTMSLILTEYADHPKPWLIGMAVAVAVAGAVRGQVRWPNDVSLRGRKVAGILSEIVVGPHGRVPVVGVGVNLNQSSFPPEIAETATSLALAARVPERPAVPESPVDPLAPPQKAPVRLPAPPEAPLPHFEPTDIAEAILSRLADIPDPHTWDDLRPIWMLFDATPGKKYRLPSGEEATAIGLGPNGELICSVNGETQMVLAGDALFGG